jgi:hypothetical protein
MGLAGHRDPWLRRLYVLIFYDGFCFGGFDFLIFFFDGSCFGSYLLVLIFFSFSHDSGNF